MVQTPVSSTTAYCTPAQFINWFDVRTVGDLVMDDATRAAPAELLTNAVLIQFLQEASGKVEAACLMGNRYSVDDLEALLTPITISPGVDVLSNSAVFLAGIVAGIAGGELSRRRPGVDIPESMKAKIEEGEKALESLSLGERIFSFAEAAKAGKLDEVYDSPTNVWQRFGVPVQMHRFFGRRSNQYWGNRFPTINDVTG